MGHEWGTNARARERRVAPEPASSSHRDRDAVVDEALSPHFPLGVDLELFIRRMDAERFIDGVRGDDPEVAAQMHIEERELEGVVG